MANKVAPLNTAALDLDNLNPDLNGDGKVEPWEQQIFNAMKAADVDGDGFLQRSELFDVIMTFGKEAVRPKTPGQQVGIPIVDLNPDTDGDGQIEAWEQECYQQIKNADADGSGSISVKELFGVMKKAGDAVKEAKANSGIPIESLNPDTDGDGKVEPWEVDVFERIKAADADASGVISTKELFGVIKGAAESDKQKKLFQKLAMVLVGVICVLVGLICAVSIVGAVVGGNAIKEAKMPDCSSGNNPLCAAAVVSTNKVESFIPSVFGLAAVPTNQMAYIKDVSMFIDMSSSPAIGRTVEASFKLAGAYKFSDTQAYLVTSNGYTISLDATNSIGAITMDGSTFPLTETAPTTGRRLQTNPHKPMAKTMTARQAYSVIRERRRRLNHEGPPPMFGMAAFDAPPMAPPNMTDAALYDVVPMPMAGDILEPSPSPGAYYGRQLGDERELMASPSPAPDEGPSWEEYMGEKADFTMLATGDKDRA
jgi:Ca2+-binding EF-hand superfamily protein